MVGKYLYYILLSKKVNLTIVNSNNCIKAKEPKMSKVFESITDLVGKTPLVHLKGFEKKTSGYYDY